MKETIDNNNSGIITGTSSSNSRSGGGGGRNGLVSVVSTRTVMTTGSSVVSNGTNLSHNSNPQYQHHQQQHHHSINLISSNHTTGTTTATTTNGTTWLTLELNAQQQQQQQQQTSSSTAMTNNDELFHVRRTDLNDGSIRLVITLPRLMDAEQANLTAALLFEQMDIVQQQQQQQQQQDEDALTTGQLGARTIPTPSIVVSSSTKCYVERVKLQGLQFTEQGVAVINEFLSTHAATIKHVSLKDMVRPDVTNKNSSTISTDDQQQQQLHAFESLARVFTDAPIEILNLSDNVLPGSLWSCWSNHTTIRQLILDYVIMDDNSLQCLQQSFYHMSQTLEELYIVLLNVPTSTIGTNAANQILRQCTRISSLRWAIKDPPIDAQLPYHGLADMTNHNNNNNNNNTNNQSATRVTTAATVTPSYSSLLHLVMDGGSIILTNSSVSVNVNGSFGITSECQSLCSALQTMNQLRSLKLRSIGIRDDNVGYLMQAILRSQAPLESIDLSRNSIQNNGAKAICDIITAGCSSSTTGTTTNHGYDIMKTLQTFQLDKNQIEIHGAQMLYETFGQYALSSRFELRLENNSFHYGKITFHLAYKKGIVTKENISLTNECQQMKEELVRVNNKDSNPEIRILQEEINKLTDERNTLTKAFHVMGITSQVEEQKMLFDRLKQLENIVLGYEQNPPQTRQNVSTNTTTTTTAGVGTNHSNHSYNNNSNSILSHPSPNQRERVPVTPQTSGELVAMKQAHQQQLQQQQQQRPMAPRRQSNEVMDHNSNSNATYSPGRVIREAVVPLLRHHGGNVPIRDTNQGSMINDRWSHQHSPMNNNNNSGSFSSNNISTGSALTPNSGSGKQKNTLSTSSLQKISNNNSSNNCNYITNGVGIVRSPTNKAGRTTKEGSDVTPNKLSYSSPGPSQRNASVNLGGRLHHHHPHNNNNHHHSVSTYSSDGLDSDYQCQSPLVTAYTHNTAPVPISQQSTTTTATNSSMNRVSSISSIRNGDTYGYAPNANSSNQSGQYPTVEAVTSVNGVTTHSQ